MSGPNLDPSKVLSLQVLEDLTTPVVAKSEQEMRAIFDTIKSGADIDAAHLLYFTHKVTQNTAIVTWSATTAKDRKDLILDTMRKMS